MSRRNFLRSRGLRGGLAWRAVAILVMLGGGGAEVWAAPRDRVPPTTPTNLRVTGVTATSVTLSWNASSDDSGSFNYYLVSSAGVTAYVPQSYTSYTFVSGHTAGETYTFHVYAQDAARNRSANSNTATATLPLLTDPPTTPVLLMPDVTSRRIALSWTPSQGDAVRYWLYDNGVQILQWHQTTSFTLWLQEPGSTHTFTVRGRDTRGNWSEFSEPLTVKTAPIDPNDYKPPSTPMDLSESHFGDGEVWLSWTQSTDNVTPQRAIIYEVYMNGELSDMQFGSGARSINYGNFGEWNTVEVIAIDEAGNRSAAGTLTFFLN